MNKKPLLRGFFNKIWKIVLTIEKATSKTYYKKETYPGSPDDDEFDCCWVISILWKKELFHTDVSDEMRGRLRYGRPN